MAAICEEFDLWLHLDGSWGSPLALFADDKEIFEYNVPYGKVNSFTINPHKLLGIPLQCSFLIMRDGIGIMKETLGLEANYLFHQPSPQSSDGDGAGSLKDRLGGSWDVGDATMGCGRRPDAIKFWVCWRYYGTQYFKQRVTRARQLSIMLADMVSTRESSFGRWKLFNEPQSTCVCFWFIPNFLAELEGNEEVYNGKLDRVTKDIADFINSTGAALIDFASVELVKDRTRFVVPSFFRVPLNNPNVTKETLQFVLDCIEDSASKLYSSDHMTGP
ncbi:Glutamate decarboxylase 2 [Dipsacomyces acuminosporus]|nr:Glutamate decarboxylase 2 [Dipsacomyces acuminosporus]